MIPTAFIFDVDDTLYFERDYSYSSLNFVADIIQDEVGKTTHQKLIGLFDQGNKDAIGVICQSVGISDERKTQIILEMQNHSPTISLRKDAEIFLSLLRRNSVPFGLVTDGRTNTQRAKIAALGIDDANSISISGETGFQKPHGGAFAPIISEIEAENFIFVGDNPKKDFYYPNEMGWASVMLELAGKGVHSQTLPKDEKYHPKTIIAEFSQLESFL